MSRFFTVGIKCPGCQGTTPARSKYPGFMSTETISVTCSICESELFVKLRRIQTKIQGNVQCAIKISKPSKALIEMLAEELKEKNATQVAESPAATG